MEHKATCVCVIVAVVVVETMLYTNQSRVKMKCENTKCVGVTNVLDPAGALCVPHSSLEVLGGCYMESSFVPWCYFGMEAK